MSDRGYTLVEVPVEGRLGADPDLNLIVRVMEHVRRNLRAIAPDVPKGCEIDLLAAGTAHNVGVRPLLGIYAPPDLAPSFPDPFAVQRRVDEWCERQSADSLRAIGRRTDAPTWQELQVAGAHPLRT